MPTESHGVRNFTTVSELRALLDEVAAPDDARLEFHEDDRDGNWAELSWYRPETDAEREERERNERNDAAAAELRTKNHAVMRRAVYEALREQYGDDGPTAFFTIAEPPGGMGELPEGAALLFQNVTLPTGGAGSVLGVVKASRKTETGYAYEVEIDAP